MSLLETLRTQLTHAAGQLPVGLLASLHSTVVETQAQLLPELADSDS